MGRSIEGSHINHARNKKLQNTYACKSALLIGCCPFSKDYMSVMVFCLGLSLHAGFKIGLLVLISVAIGVAASLYHLYYIQPQFTTSTSSTSMTPPTTSILPIDPSRIDLEVEISSVDGLKEFRDIAVINVEDVDSLLFRSIDVRIDGLSSISLSGRVLLVSDNNSYTIDMPCILRLNVSCPRITAIILGYDAPLRVESGRYLASIELSWSEAKGRGGVYLSLSPRAYDAVIIYLGSYQPEDTSGWITAEGFTRSYALLVDKTKASTGRSGYGKFTVHVWVFEAVGEEYGKFRLELTSLETGKIMAVLEVPVKKQGPYYQALLVVKAKPGEYLLRITSPVSLKIELKVEE